MKHATRSIYRAPLLAAAAMILALSLWGLWSWQGYSERSLEWRRQRAQETFQTLNAIIATMSNGVLTDWQQIERVLASITRDSRTAFVVVEARHGRLVQTGDVPELLVTGGDSGEMDTDSMLIVWAPLQQVNLPSTWAEALESPHFGLGLWMRSNPVMYLGFRSRSETFATSWYWQRQAPIFALAMVCILAVTAAWIAGNRRRLLAGELAAERLHSAHLEELGLAAAGLAHETKNPLGIIMGMAQQIAARPDIPSESRTMLEHIMDEVDKTTSRLGNFMNFARQRNVNPGPVAVDRLCRELTDVMGPDFDLAGVGLESVVPAAVILADEALLRQILVNLLLNSLHASPAGTVVRIRMQRQGRRWQLIVEDQGTGIAPELLPNIFKPYVSGSASGHGLGLAIVKRLVESHGWKIQASSIPAGGTAMAISGIRNAQERA